MGWAVVVALLSVTIIYCRNLQTKAHSWGSILAAYQEDGDYNDITIEYPLDGTLFPPEMVPPLFRWADSAPSAKAWLVQFASSSEKPPLCFWSRRQQWKPRVQDWCDIKHGGWEREARVLVLGVDAKRAGRIVSKGQISFSLSKDPVAAPLFYREVELPFAEANKHLTKIRWRFGLIGSPQPPPVVLTDLPVCGNCHSFSLNGKTLAMDVDYANSKGSYAITAVQQEITLAPQDIITWHDFAKVGTHGLLSQISPDGRYVVSTVEDLSVFVHGSSAAFSQVFFPVKGILCVFDRETGQFRALPGADDPQFVQTNPVWSPDGEYIVFARARAPDLGNTKHQGYVWLTPIESRQFIKANDPFRYDLYRIPLNRGEGGNAEPMAGASHNGMSNYFPRYSPDGRWIVFCRARAYMLLQPDSELYIIPAQGGQARRLRCNTPRMNSWHAWSPNGKWLVFTSKAYSDYTQLCLTHIDDNGYSTPPVLLDHLTAPDRAANIPEFVNAHPGAITRIRARFLDN